MAGPNTHILSIVPNTHVDITGISGSPIEQLPLVQCAAFVNTLDEGQVILIMSQYAYSPKGKTIHSKSQLESFGCSVHDSALRAGGKQCIYTPEGYVIPLHVRHGLFHMDMQPPTDDDLHNHPHVFLTADSPWNPDNVDEEFHHDVLTDTALPLQKTYFFKAFRMHVITMLTLMVVFICISSTPYRTNQLLQMICFLTLMNPLTRTQLPT